MLKVILTCKKRSTTKNVVVCGNSFDDTASSCNLREAVGLFWYFLWKMWGKHVQIMKYPYTSNSD